MLFIIAVKGKCDILQKLVLYGEEFKLCLSFTQDKFSTRIDEKVLKKNGGDNSLVHVDTNAMTGTRIIVTLRERIPHKMLIKKKDLAIGTLFS